METIVIHFTFAASSIEESGGTLPHQNTTQRVHKQWDVFTFPGDARSCAIVNDIFDYDLLCIYNLINEIHLSTRQLLYAMQYFHNDT